MLLRQEPYPSAKTFDASRKRCINNSFIKQSGIRFCTITIKTPGIRMSKTVQIGSKSQFDSLLQSSKIVVTDCKQAPSPHLTLLPEGPSLQEACYRDDILIRSRTVYADWCGPCKQIAPIYEQLSAQLSRSNKITFARVDTEQQREVAQQYGVTA